MVSGGQCNTRVKSLCWSVKPQGLAGSPGVGVQGLLTARSFRTWMCQRREGQAPEGSALGVDVRERRSLATCRELSRRLSEEMPLGYKKKPAKEGVQKIRVHSCQGPDGMCHHQTKSVGSELAGRRLIQYLIRLADIPKQIQIQFLLDGAYADRCGCDSYAATGAATGPEFSVSAK